MDTRDTSGPAFPVADYDHQTFAPKNVAEARRLLSGMSLRDYFAVHADIGDVDQLTMTTGVRLLGRNCPLMQADPKACLEWWAEYRARLRYIEADAMLKERA